MIIVLERNQNVLPANDSPSRFIFFVLIAVFLFHTQSNFSQPNAELILRNVKCNIENNTLTYSVSNEIRINNRNGDKFTRITIPYNGKFKIDKLQAYLKDSEGNIVRKLQKSEITKRSSISSISLYEDDYVLEFKLNHNTYPYSIYYSYNQRFKRFITIINEIPILALDIPTRKVLVSLVHPSDYKIFSYANNFTEIHSSSLDGMIQHQWSSSYEGNLDKELHSAPINDFLPQLRVFPENFNYEIPGSLKSWISFGNWIEELSKDLSDLPESERRIIHELVKGEDEDIKKMKILFEYLQDKTRYINVTIETGGLKPYPASYVVENRYGDCKALSNYYKAMLDEIRIPSFYTLINAGEKVDGINKEIPGSQFNHVIICVIGIEDTVWVDCTSIHPFQYTGTFIQNREAFAISKDSSFFIKTPGLTADRVLNERIATIDLSDINSVALKINTKYRGKGYELMDYAIKSIDQNEKKRFINNNLIPDGCEVTKYEFQKFNRDATEIAFDMEGRSKSMARKYGNDVLVQILAFSIPDFEKPENRELPVQINYPICETDSLIYRGISEEDTLYLPDLDITSDFGHYKRRLIVDGSNIIVHKSYLIYPGKIELAKYQEFYDFVFKIKEIERRSSLIIKTENSNL